MVSLVMRRGAENIKEKKRKPTEENYWKIKRMKNEEYDES